MLVLLPPSESKTAVRRGKPLQPEALSFPSLAPTRAAVLDALVAMSAEPDAARRLGVPPTLEPLVRRNVDLRSAPTATAGQVYSGVLYDALDVASLDGPALRRARAWIVVVSALWGAVRLGDRIPAYRLSMCGRLPGLGHLPQVWQRPLDGALPAAARRGVIVDCRSSDYLTAWRPTGELAHRTVRIRVLRERDGILAAASHQAKYTRGLVARRIVLDGLDAQTPQQLAEGLSASFEVKLRLGDRRGWELQVVEP